MQKKYPYPSGEGKVRWISTEWLEKNLDNSIMYYHCEKCPLLQNKDIIIDTRSECAKSGALPCKICKP